ncbi:MAG: aminoacyl-tRNA hydrolase [Candidatus Omnitrophota bacterium]|nr:aminoacyl-tRNA hydrolase [Candidatus Omnitrophota bacterium]
MKLIVGLGNPGDNYKDSRHNVGFRLVRALAKDQAAALKRDWGTQALSARTKINGQAALVAIPLTYMNLSGKAVRALVKKYKVALVDLLIVVDDLDLELGRQKIRPGGSSGGHKGLESVAASLSTPLFARLRIGIGRPHRGIDSAEYVLMPFLKKEKEIIDGIIDDAVECCRSWVTDGMDKTMEKFNRSIIGEKQ